jgi:predicted AAA+ superfamily ATPase
LALKNCGCLVFILYLFHNLPELKPAICRLPNPQFAADTGIAATLMDLNTEDWNVRRQDFGHLLESFVIQQLIAQAGWTDPTLEFYYYRDRDQLEVDCVITRGNRVWGIEVKTARSVDPSDLVGLKRLAEQAGQDFQCGIILYAGENTFRMGENRFLAVPLSKLWEL